MIENTDKTNRKHIRLKDYDYSTPGYYFITVCTKDKKPILNRIVGTDVPTNNTISNFIGTFKRLCNKKFGKNIWQYRSYDHIIRDECDYRKNLGVH
jgi:REP element-mobilizing transposase RayT